jgi:hypothetical protein
MKQRLAWTLALPLALTCTAEVRAQGFYYGSGGAAQGGGLGFSYQRRNLSVFGFLGGFSSGRYSAGAYLFDPYGPPPVFYGPYPPAVIVLPPPVVLQRVGPRILKPQPSLEDEIRGIDLDAVPPTPKSLREEKPPEPPPPDLPGKDVSKPVPPVRPGEPPPPKGKVPPDKAPPAKKGPVQPPPPGPPKDDPKEESVRLTNLGLAAFGGQAYGLAAHRFRQATRVDPNGARAYFLLAQAQFALGKYHQAVESIHAGMRLHKDWPMAPFQPRLDLYGGIEPDFAEHLKRLEGVLKEDPNNPELLFLLAYQLWFDGRRNEAVARFRQVRPLTPDPSFINQFLAAAKAGQVVAK